MKIPVVRPKAKNQIQRVPKIRSKGTKKNKLTAQRERKVSTIVKKWLINHSQIPNSQHSQN
jgi:hypothetical protein